MAVIGGDRPQTSFHLPKTEQGVFVGENALDEQDQGDVLVLDDGTVTEMGGPVLVDHDQRWVKWQMSQEHFAEQIGPPALPLGHTQERREQQDPIRVITLPDGSTKKVSGWGFTLGTEINVQERGAGSNTRRYFDVEQRFDGELTERPIRSDEQSIKVYDFEWQFEWRDEGPYGLEAESYQRQATAYRWVKTTIWKVGNPLEMELTIEGHIEGVWLYGEIGLGREGFVDRRHRDVTAVLDYERQSDGRILRTKVSMWTLIASLSQEVGTQPLTQPPGEGYEPEYGQSGQIYDYVSRQVDEPVTRLRDTLIHDWPRPPDPPPKRFVAGAVSVSGGPTFTTAKLLKGEELTAYGHTFTAGSWAALRDTPKRQADGSWDFAPLIILHASDSTVTAIRPDGKTERCPLAQFEREVLRVPQGSFNGFNSVGSLSHSWPPQWAWAHCQDGEQPNETRAIAAHDAWRDSYKKGAPLGSPLNWTWKARPAKRPKTLPKTAPRGLLGLTLADVTGGVTQDEPLKKGEGPYRLPKSATVDGRDVLGAVAKRTLYQPAHWVDEVSDGTSTTGPLALDFGALPVVPPPGPEQKTGKLVAALHLRYKGKKPEINVDGTPTPLIKLGHNAAEKSGWHAYVLDVPPQQTYTLTYSGRISLALLCVRVTLPYTDPDT